VAREVDDAHAALADLLLQRVLPEAARLLIKVSIKPGTPPQDRAIGSSSAEAWCEAPPSRMTL
jgi:hypothetical protein